MKTPLYDLHIHTHLSVCSGCAEQNVENIVKYAKANGISTVGIADHVWDCEIPAGNDFYAQQPFSHIRKVRQEIPEELGGVRLLLGAEIEFAQNTVMLKKEYRDQLDYMLVPHSHIHMVGVTLPAEYNSSFELKAKYLVESFCSLASQDIATIIAHPFDALGHDNEGKKAIFAHISDDTFAKCFTLAKEHKVGIELNGGAIRNAWGDEETMKLLHDRLFSIARDCGCTFTLGSDGHNPVELEQIHLAVKMAERLGLSEDRFLKI